MLGPGGLVRRACDSCLFYGKPIVNMSGTDDGTAPAIRGAKCRWGRLNAGAVAENRPLLM